MLTRLTSQRLRDALALFRQRFDLDACAANCGAAAEDQIAVGIASLTIGNADVSVSPGQRRPHAHRENALKIAHRIKDIFFESRGESIPAEVRPDAVLFAERAGPVGAERPAAA